MLTSHNCIPFFFSWKVKQEYTKTHLRCSHASFIPASSITNGHSCKMEEYYRKNSEKRANIKKHSCQGTDRGVHTQEWEFHYVILFASLQKRQCKSLVIIKKLEGKFNVGKIFCSDSKSGKKTKQLFSWVAYVLKDKKSSPFSAWALITQNARFLTSRKRGKKPQTTLY